jgi:multidrug efflux system membrane fusion protein
MPAEPTSPADLPAAKPPQGPVWRRRGTLVALAVVLVIGGLAWFLTHRARAPGPGAAFGRGGPPSTVGVARARHADIPVIIDALGTVTSRASVIVTPQVSGVITQILYREGQLVAKGQLLATLDPQPFQAALAQASGALMRDRAQLDAARQQLGRYQVLLKQDSIAGQTVDTQAALVQQLVGTVALDQANETTARLNLQWSRIVAPVSGRVGLRPVDAGNFVSAGLATGVATITQISPIDVAFSIPQERVAEIEQRLAGGAAVLPVTTWDSNRTKQLDSGSFSTLDNQIDTSTGTVKAKAAFANAAGVLFPNQFVNVRLLLRTLSAAVVVPVTALRHGPNGDFVYIVNPDQTVSLRSVTAGLAGVDDVDITQGLSVGESVVTEGGDRLKDGARVQTGAGRPAGAASGAREGRGRRGGGASGAGGPGWAASAGSAGAAGSAAWAGHRRHGDGSAGVAAGSGS